MHISRFACTLAFGAITAALAMPASAQDLKPIFDGKTLTGWKQLGGKAKYTVEEGAIVGRSVPNTPNSFLTTEEHYGDFVLEYEFKVDEALNSGVQIRSQSLPDYKNGRVHGYQAEIDPDTKRARLWTAGIFEEGRRGWLYPVKGNAAQEKVFSEAGAKAFKPGDWNHVRIEANGDSIKTFLNGTPRADLRDSLTLKGFVGLQVHGVGKRTETLTVRWRNLKIADLGEHTWQPLFDGKTTNGWEALPGGSWAVEDGVLIGRNPKTDKRHGQMISTDRYKDFTVRAEYKAIKGNSGLYFRVDKVKHAVAVNGFQAEIDANKDAGGLYETGGRAWVIKPTADVVKKCFKPGEWNTMTVSAHGTRVTVHVNGHKTAELLDDQKGRREGHLALQLHGNQDMEVRFRKIEILRPAKTK